MKTVNIHEAKTHLSRLVEQVEAGEEIVIAKAGRPAARLVPLESARKPIKIGGLRGRLKVPDDFNRMFEREIEAMFGAASPPPSARNRK
jgi:prevent-host-death family protein